MKTVLEQNVVGDARLVELCLKQDRQAFGVIVGRYQSLICAIAYSACGDVGRSEDLAQDTFVTAWRKLGELREPERLKSWLCGIVRNLSQNAVRRETRAPVGQAVPMEAEVRSEGADPHEQAVSNEEEALVWRALEGIPEEYREPMVLFYREGQSTEAVAAALDLTEPAVWQRLSRGRKMLKESVAKTVESTLGRSVPGRAFTAAVLAALPAGMATSAKAATLGAVVVKSGTALKTGVTLASAGSLLALFGSGFFKMKERVERTKSPRERRFEIRMIWTELLVVAVVGALMFGGHAILTARLGAGWDRFDDQVACAVGFFGLACYSVARAEYASRRKKQIQKEDGTLVEAEWAEEEVSPVVPKTPLSKYGLLSMLAAFAGLVVVMTMEAAAGHWWKAAIWLGLGGLMLLRGVRQLREAPRYHVTAAVRMKLAAVMGLFTLLFFNMELWRGKLGVEPMSAAAIGFNAAVVVVYGVFVAFLAGREKGEVKRGK